jgi:hypothetical protein
MMIIFVKCKFKNDESLDIKGLIQNINLMFSQVKDFFYITKFQSRSLPYDHGLLWIENDPRYGVFKMKN